MDVIIMLWHVRLMPILITLNYTPQTKSKVKLNELKSENVEQSNLKEDNRYSGASTNATLR
jgi:hypothetical protein